MNTNTPARPATFPVPANSAPGALGERWELLPAYMTPRKLAHNQLETNVSPIGYATDVYADGKGAAYTCPLEYIGDRERAAKVVEALNRPENPVAILTEAEETRRGEMLAQLLGLRRIRSGADAGRFRTEEGTKTALGLFRTVARVVLDGE